MELLRRLKEMYQVNRAAERRAVLRRLLRECGATFTWDQGTMSAWLTVHGQRWELRNPTVEEVTSYLNGEELKRTRVTVES